MRDRENKIIQLFKTAQKKKEKKETQLSIAQTINGNNNIQVGGDFINVTTKTPTIIKIEPPQGTIGSDPILKQAILRRFNKLGEEREKRFGKQAYAVMYKKFKKDFGIENAHWTIIWTWPKECAEAIIQYLDDKYNNTIAGRIEKATKKETYLHSRPFLYKKEKELLEQLGYNLSSPEIKKALKKYFGVDSHKDLSHLNHWLWVCYLEDCVKKLEDE